jgi:uncharacterized protein (DUF362 family)
MVLIYLKSIEDNEKSMKRRSFIQASITSLALTSCSTPPPLLDKLSKPTPKQKSARRPAPSIVGILKADSYSDDLFTIIKKNLPALKIDDLKGRSVVLKPNMVECPPGKPVTTNPAVLKAVIQLMDYLGAREIVVAEGPGHMRDTEYILEATGIGPACKEMAIPFIDLNLDDLVKVSIEESFCGLDHFYLPKTIINAQAVINLPKLKTHHWVGMTGSLKNMFGIVPGRKYGYPKNLLHVYGIPQCIIDLNRIVQTKLSVVDGITAMEGDGPVNGTARHMGLIIIGTDPAAVDATSARIMGYDIDELDYIDIAGQVIGNVKADEIQIVGPAIKDVAVEFQRPITYLRDKKPAEKLMRDRAQFVAG